jgi:hypothetical protein
MSVVNLVKKAKVTDRGKGSHKLPTEAINLILDMSVRGASNTAILEAIEDRFKVKLHQNMLAYYRKTRAVELKELYRDEIAYAKAECDLARLVNRIGLLDQIVKKEMAKPNGSVQLIARVVSQIGTMIYRYELLALKEHEQKKKNETEVFASEEHELMLQEMERWSHFSKSKSV